jgi:4-diphosphocytidyl-2-C-methyl-D-erythritol kinase
VRLSARAPGKVNLCLFLGPVRDDGRHELVTLFESVSLADEVTMVAADRDEVLCPGVSGTNIVERALAGLRQRGWAAPPVRVTIEKRIPVAGGMGGGSADAAAVLRLAPLLAAVPSESVAELAAALGSDVPSQLVLGVSIGTGAGDLVQRIDALEPHGFVIVPQGYGLSTAEVYREADRRELPRTASALAERHRLLVKAARGSAYPLVNDLEPAALSLRPEIGRALEAVREAGADHAMVSGSGPTVFGLFTGPDASARAEAVAIGLADRYPGATSAAPVSEEFGAPRGS